MLADTVISIAGMPWHGSWAQAALCKCMSLFCTGLGSCMENTHPHLPFPWYLYLGSVKKQLEINCHWGKEWDGRNWASLESFLHLPAAGLVLWAVRKSDGIPFRNLTLDCTCAAFQELSCWQALRVIQIQARPCSQEDGFSFKTCASRFGIS